jgi:pimeloyl-ACP methyl ester carboxylesterase
MRPLFCVLWLLTGCIGTRLVELDNLDVPSPPLRSKDSWRGDVRALLERYEHAPVLAPEDEHLEPLFGGLTTLSYFGADAKSRALDQKLSAASQAADLAQVCTRTAPTAPIGIDLPAFEALWIPLAIHGGEAEPGVQCDEHGTPTGEGKEQSYCMFARAALQPGARSLIVVAHGLFDSGAQYYVQRTAAVLYQQGHSVLLPDLRDHGETLRAAPQLATTLGVLEGPDLLVLAGLVRQHCAARVTRVGLAGVSGGGLAAIRAFTLDAAGALDAGVLALSPLLDVDTATHDLSRTGACPVTRSIELTWLDVVLLSAAAGAATFAGAALAQAVDGAPLGASTAIAGGIGAGVGAALGLAADAWLDGSSEACVSQNAIAHMVQDALRVRWRALRGREALSPRGNQLDPSAVTLADYMRERVQYRAALEHITLQRFEPSVLASDLRHALRARSHARLLVLGAADDPMTREAALRAFIARTRDVPQIYAHSVQHGGHAAMLLVQPTITEQLYKRFFEPH